jgi:hypothetical protein
MLTPKQVAEINHALTAITNSLNTIAAIRDDISEADENEYGLHFGAIEEHGTRMEKWGRKLWEKIKP